MIKQAILDLKKKTALPGINFDNIDYVLDEAIDDQYFEMLLIEIRGSILCTEREKN